MFAMTCICVRSLAIVNRVGAERLAATVWPDVHVARNDDAVDRRSDRRVGQVNFGKTQRCLRLLHLRLRLLHLRLRLLHLRLRLLHLSL